MKAFGLPAGSLRRPRRGREALARGVRSVKALGLDERYGLKIGPSLAAAA